GGVHDRLRGAGGGDVRAAVPGGDVDSQAHFPRGPAFVDSRAAAAPRPDGAGGPRPCAAPPALRGGGAGRRGRVGGAAGRGGGGSEVVALRGLVVLVVVAGGLGGFQPRDLRDRDVPPAVSGRVGAVQVGVDHDRGGLGRALGAPVGGPEGFGV